MGKEAKKKKKNRTSEGLDLIKGLRTGETS